MILLAIRSIGNLQRIWPSMCLGQFVLNDRDTVIEHDSNAAFLKYIECLIRKTVVRARHAAIMETGCSKIVSRHTKGLKFKSNGEMYVESVLGFAFWPEALQLIINSASPCRNLERAPAKTLRMSLKF